MNTKLKDARIFKVSDDVMKKTLLLGKWFHSNNPFVSPEWKYRPKLTLDVSYDATEAEEKFS